MMIGCNQITRALPSRLILIIFGFTLLILLSLNFSNINSSVYGQIDDDIDSKSTLLIKNNKNISNNNPLIPLEKQSLTSKQNQPNDFVSNGMINSVLTVGKNKWLATGEWKMILSKGHISLLEVSMIWYNSSGTNAHTHELVNFKSTVGKQEVFLQKSTNHIIIRGTADVGTNNQVSWTSVPVTITIKGNKIITISLDNKATNNHFGAQPILGIVNSLIPCSDIPGPNMEVSPPCTPNVSGEGIISKPFGTTTITPPPSTTSPSNIIKSDTTPLSLDGNSIDLDDVLDGVNIISTEEKDDTECDKLNIMNVKASGFETDPEDYHPPFDAIDGDSSTWWSNQDEDSWIKFDLGSEHLICGLSIEWNKGDEREYEFEISLSNNNVKFDKVYEGSSSGSGDFESYNFEEVSNGRHVMLSITGTTSDKGWVSIQELNIMGKSK